MHGSFTASGPPSMATSAISKPVGEGVIEMRVHVGPGYRIYFTRCGEVVYLLLLGGDKSSQKRDIKCAIEMARDLDKE